MIDLRPCFAILVLACAGCERAAPPAASVAMPAAAPADQRVDAASTDRYRYEIRYPALAADQAPLAEALHAYAEQQKREFLAAPGGPAPDGASYPWTLELAFDLRAQTGDFVAVLAEGSAYTGGAHGNPLLASFTLHRPSRRVVSLADLFADPDAGLRALAEHVRHTLSAGGNAETLGRIKDGTEPRPENYAVFLVERADDGRAAGLTLIFPPHQIAADAAGTRQVNVPAPVFAGLLKPEFRRDFAASPP